MAIQDMTVKTLVKVLARLRGGEIGFDPYRDPRTQTKAALLSFILSNYSNEEILEALNAEEAATTAALEAPPVRETSAISAPVSVTGIPLPGHDAVAAGQQIAAILAGLTKQAAPIDEAAVKGIVAAQVSGLLVTVQEMLDKITKPTRVIVGNTTTATTVDCGICHKNFPTLLKACSARTSDGHHLNIWLRGPAGSGKTTAAHKAADALGLKFYFNGAISTEYELMGFIDAAGNYHRTQFRDAFEHGGVYLFDEVDSSNASAVLRFQAALANGVCPFPDGMVTRHADCVILAGANTNGNGATTDYNGRFKMDKAFLDRFVDMEWPIDEALESAITPNAEWTKKCQDMRKAIATRGLKNHMVTPRASIYGAALLAAGLPEELVTDMVLRKGLSDEQWGQIS
jgi:cobaltochelatase CobS